MAKTAFVSHASEDATVASTISEYLERSGVSCWIAPRDVHPGADYASEIIDGIESSAVLVLVLSEHANTSEFVKREVERAVSKGKPIFPVRVREVVPSKSLELFISSAEWIDAWHPPIEQYLERLAESIRSASALYPPGRDQPAGASSSPRVSSGKGAIGLPPPDVRDSPRNQRAIVMALGSAVVVLAALLLWSMFRTPSAAVSSAAGTTSPSSPIDPPTATASVVEAPGPAHTAAAGTVAISSAATDPCPRSLGIMPDLPTPFSCTCGGPSTSEGAVWGTDVYTDDSGLCRAAMHAGVVSAQGGPITVSRIAGRPLYIGTTRNGVTSSDYPANARSIEFKGTAPPQAGPGLCPGYLGISPELPTPFTCRCITDAVSRGAVWGTDVYTDDSSICRAALHAGKVPPSGGIVTVDRIDGRQLYVGTTRNGVASSDYPAFPASIKFR